MGGQQSSSSSYQTPIDDLPIYLYVLELEHEKYYVGVTQDGLISEWTKVYPPISTIKAVMFSGCLEREIRLLMTEHGTDNVRGGKIKRRNWWLGIERMRHPNPRPPNQRPCALLSGVGRKHPASQCTEFTTNFGIPISEIRFCSQCGRDWHCGQNYSARSCWYDINRDNQAHPMSFCQRCGRTDHHVVDCFHRTTYTGKPI